MGNIKTVLLSLDDNGKYGDGTAVTGRQWQI
jgi:hypothetical protein